MAARSVDALGEKNKPWTVQDALDDYLRFLETERRSSRDARYKSEAFILPKFGKREISSLTIDELRRWLADLAKTPPRIRSAKTGKRAKGQRYREIDLDDEEAKRRRKSTVNRILTTFKAALNRAFRDGKVASDVVWRRLEPFKAVDSAREEFLTVEEAKRVINASEPAFRQLVQAALLTGARYGELCRLTVGDFHARHGSHTIYIHASKSGKDRHIFLTDEGIKFFSHLVVGRAKKEPMLKKASGTPWQTSQQIREMKETCERARVRPVGFHALRHSWASLAVMGGVPLMVVARNLGHADTRMVEKHYGHLLKSYERDQIRKNAPTFGIKTKTNIVSLGAKKK
jgi:integrase